MNPWGSNPSTKRRDKLFIIAEILEISREGSLKTQIMYRANLSFTQLNDYLKFMLNISLLEKGLVNGKDTYKSSIKGLDFLQRYKEIAELIKDDDENNGKNGVRIPPQHLLKRTQSTP
ncbi:winged helix-turn-helix domain-containing protein [Candidatus Bathyarchaeota archaeon]|nr:winged helix-turn-helix domain-containing protein [Candidatus Bathyarchaeota archaeon]